MESRKHLGMNPHEKELLGNLKSYDKAPENLKLEFLHIKRKKSVLRTK